MGGWEGGKDGDIESWEGERRGGSDGAAEQLADWGGRRGERGREEGKEQLREAGGKGATERRSEQLIGTIDQQLIEDLTFSHSHLTFSGHSGLHLLVTGG